MKTRRIVLSTVLIALLALSPLVGCSACGEMPTESTTSSTFSYSDGIDENGFWEGITATDYVELFDYEALEIPKDVHEIPDSSVQSQIDYLLSSYATVQEISDRPSEVGDTVNVDYVGTVDGVEYEGGSSGGEGMEFIIGTSTFVDDFVDQLVGHVAGDTFDVTVTFPEDYGNDTLNGKEVVFAVIMNSVGVKVNPELTDAFVAENLTESYGWKTVDELKEEISSDLQASAIQEYVQEYLATVEVSSIPESILQYQEDAFVFYYETYAEMSGLTLEEFLSTHGGATDMETLLLESQEDIRKSAVYSLTVQAIAEDAELSVSDEDVADYFLETMGEADYSEYEEQYGLPYLKQSVLTQKVLDIIEEHVVLEK